MLIEPIASVVHVLPGLTVGGTELMVLRLAKAERQKGINSSVLSLHGEGPLSERFRNAGVPVFFPWALPAKSPSPTIWHGWLYSGNLYAGWKKNPPRGDRVIWGLMQANVSPTVNSLKTRMLMKLGAHFSRRWPDAIVCNSSAAQVAHEGLGFDGSQMRVIPNGIDIALFKPSDEHRARFRGQQGLSPDALVLGHLARWDPQKDHRTLVQAVGLLLKQGVRAHLFMAGPGVTASNGLLMKWIAETGFTECFHLLGPIEDAPSFLATLDIFCLSSVGESSSCALQEAMACGVPVVSTDVGDAREVVREAGVVVPPSDPKLFAEGVQCLVKTGTEGRVRLGRAARERIVHGYSFDAMATAYQNLYKDLAKTASPFSEP